MNRKVVMKEYNWSDGFGVILKRTLFVEKKMAAGRHLEFDTLVPRAQLCPPGSQLRTPWATSVPNFSSEQRKKTNFHFWSRFSTWLGDYIAVIIIIGRTCP